MINRKLGLNKQYLNNKLSYIYKKNITTKNIPHIYIYDERMLDPEKYSVSWNPHGNLPKGHYFISIMINDLQVHYLKVIRQ